jgi:capsular exopolysaccharide synthesis family protein
MVAESFRVALTSLLFANKLAGPPRAIAISSPGPHEGKTTVACNLAISYAEINWRVLLIDGDMRRARLHSIFGIDGETGLGNLLERNQPAGREEVADAIRQTAIPNLSVMPRGKLRSTVINLLYSPRFSEVIQMARSEFDVVLIDTPPMLHLPDARAIAHLTDGVVFVVRSGKTLRDTVITARDRFRQDGIPVLGSILNDWNPKEIGYYGHDNYEDYRASYYGKELTGGGDLT